jgi:hypothetical protein
MFISAFMSGRLTFKSDHNLMPCDVCFTPKADIDRRLPNVRFVPKAGITGTAWREAVHIFAVGVYRIY